MIFRTLATLAALSFATSVCAQTVAPVQTPPPPATKIEAFSSKTGIVMIRAFSIIGRIRGQGLVTIDAREFRDASSPSQGVYGIAVEVKEAGRLERESRSFIDLDESDSLVRGLDYIAKALTLQGFAEFMKRATAIRLLKINCAKFRDVSARMNHHFIEKHATHP